MKDFNNEIPNENLTQKDIMQFLLHSTQHVATREELESARVELKNDISKVEISLKQENKELKQDIAKMDAKFDKQDDKISKIETTLRQDISKVDTKFDKIQWLIIATMFTVLFKDYIFSFIQATPTP